jgi:hypothetical protein
VTLGEAARCRCNPKEAFDLGQLKLGCGLRTRSWSVMTYARQGLMDAAARGLRAALKWPSLPPKSPHGGCLATLASPALRTTMKGAGWVLSPLLSTVGPPTTSTVSCRDRRPAFLGVAKTQPAATRHSRDSREIFSALKKRREFGRTDSPGSRRQRPRAS